MKLIFLKMLKLNFEKNILKINVKENPIIENINYKVLKQIKLKMLLKKIYNLKSRSSYNEFLFKR